MVFNTNIDFKKAIELSIGTFSYSQLIKLLKSNLIVEKQFAILNLEEVKTKEDGELLCSNLIKQDGKIREAVSFRLSELFKNSEYTKVLITDTNFEIMLEGLMDINGNVCRNILEIDNEDFNKYLAKNLIKKIKFILDDISKLKSDDKQYVISKRNFQLYWALEALYKILDYIDINSALKEILLICANFDDYTIKEKTAKIVSKINLPDKSHIIKTLKQNSNYYINRYLN